MAIIEHETQVLDIDVEEIQNKLRELGAKEEDEILQKRWVFALAEKGKRIRLRQRGDISTITHKDRGKGGISDVKEIETTIEDFNNMAEILSQLPCRDGGVYYQENKRKLFTLNELEIVIDTRPKIPPFLEIEGDSKESVKRGLSLLGLEGKDIGHKGHVYIYQKYGLDLHSYKELKF